MKDYELSYVSNVTRNENSVHIRSQRCIQVVRCDRMKELRRCHCLWTIFLRKVCTNWWNICSEIEEKCISQISITFLRRSTHLFELLLSYLGTASQAYTNTAINPINAHKFTVFLSIIALLTRQLTAQKKNTRTLNFLSKSLFTLRK